MTKYIITGLIRSDNHHPTLHFFPALWSVIESISSLFWVLLPTTLLFWFPGSPLIFRQSKLFVFSEKKYQPTAHLAKTKRHPEDSW